ncbi:MAG: TMEM43 family protein [Spirochaetota bacterium]
MTDRESFTEVTKTSWLQRLGQSIKSVGVGFLLFLVAFPVLWKNEGCAVKIAQGLSQGASEVISLPQPKVDPANNGKLIYFFGDAATDDLLTDTLLGVSEKAIKMVRKVQMYQWKEITKSKTEKKLGGSTETTTEYTYEKVWSENIIDSSSFRYPEGHNNPRSMEIPAQEFVAKNVRVGDFVLNEELIKQIQGEEIIALDESKIDRAFVGRAKKIKNEIYIGNDPNNPQIGDLKIMCTIVRSPQKVSVIAQQQSNYLTPFLTKTKTTIQMINTGIVSAEMMFQQAQESNTIRTWLVRLLGFGLMFIGLMMIFKPLVTLGDVVPFIGSVLHFGTGVVSFVVALALSLIVIAIAWIAVRPILAIILLVAGMAIFIAFKLLGNKKPQAT